MKMDPVIFREYDIRGVYNQHFDLGFAETLGQALVTYLNNKSVSNPKICLGMDARHSSPDIVAALEKGILQSGGNTVKIGLVTSPVAYFTSFYYDDIDAVIMVTGSHNPPEYNGFKLSVGHGSLFGQGIKDLEKIINDGNFSSGSGASEERDVFPDYINKHKEEFGDLSGVPVVLDCGNGAAGSVARRLYEAMNVDVEILFEEPDGDFPNHHPDPTVEKNLEWLKKAVKEKGAAAGIGFDGDADRIGVVDENSAMVDGDKLIALFAKDVLTKEPNQTIIGDVKCSDNMYDYISKYKGNAIMWKTGHSLIKQKIKDEKAPFGGELSGHVFFADRNFGYDDAPYAGLRLIEIIKNGGKKTAEIIEDYPKAFSTPELRIDTTEEKKVTIVEKLKEYFLNERKDLKTNLIDGIRVSYPDGWALARASNTQPVLVLRFEASTLESMNKIKDEVEAIVNPLL